MTLRDAEFLALPIGTIEQACLDALARLPLDWAHRTALWDQLLYAELRGKRTHGVVRVPWLVTTLGGRAHAPPVPVARTAGVSQYDCSASIGYLAADALARELVTSAQAAGCHVIVCRDAFPTGALGYYARPALAAGLVVVLFGTTPPLVCTPASAEPCLGTNPLAVGLPGGDGPPFLCDITGAAASFGEVLLSAWGADPLPADRLRTAAGTHPAVHDDLFDAAGAFTGAVLQRLDGPAARRQFSLLAAIELLSVLMAGGPSAVGNLVMVAADPARFAGFDPGAARAALDRLGAAIAPDLLPDAHGEAAAVAALERGTLALPASLWREISALAAECAA